MKNNINSFNVKDSVVALWVFKASRKRFSTVKIGDLLIEHFKSLPEKSFQEIKVFTKYDAAASHNKDVALFLEAQEVPFWDNILTNIQVPVESRYIKSISGLQNNFAYIVTYKHNGKVLYAVKKISTNLGSKSSSSFIDSIFDGETLDVSKDTVFGISKLVDFYFLDDIFYIINKDNFESILGFKDYYKKEYEEMIKSKDFQMVFDNIPVLEKYVRDNAIQLGRMYSVKQKKKYLDKNYMNAFFSYNVREDWGIEIKNNKIIFTENKVRDIVNIMLGYRVKSLCDREISDAAGLIKVSAKA